jgi:hypothetical protein
MLIMQHCGPKCPLNKGVICDRPVEAMSIHRGQLLLGKQYLPEHCPNCGKVAIWTIEDEPRGEVSTTEARTKQTA